MCQNPELSTPCPLRCTPLPHHLLFLLQGQAHISIFCIFIITNNLYCKLYCTTISAIASSSLHIGISCIIIRGALVKILMQYNILGDLVWELKLQFYVTDVETLPTITPHTILFYQSLSCRMSAVIFTTWFVAPHSRDQFTDIFI